jgi:hypothetical protein
VQPFVEERLREAQFLPLHQSENPLAQICEQRQPRVGHAVSALQAAEKTLWFEGYGLKPEPFIDSVFPQPVKPLRYAFRRFHPNPEFFRSL